VDFAFSQEQDMLRASVRAFVRARYPVHRVAAITDGAGFDRAEWAEVAGMGWTGISVSEEAGGAGLGFLEELVVVEELARGLYPGPYLATVVLALPALALAGAPAGDLVGAVASGERIATLAWTGPGGGFDPWRPPELEWDGERLSGVRSFVPDLAVADLVVVVGDAGDGPELFAVDRDGAAWRAMQAVDGTRPLGELTLDAVPARRLGPVTAAALRDLRDRALAALAVEAVAVGSAALELAVEHARTRQQFGRPIGAFQAVAHELAQGFLEVETARSLAYWAGWAAAEGAPELGVAAGSAKARAAEAAVAACERAIQAHGGIGFTWEHPLHRYYRRALGLAAFLGWGQEHRARVAASLLD
jgi:alkylation response protein AidB-like acyl-CoA dehydrogenase